jgi:predicted nucleic acid-binding protein
MSPNDRLLDTNILIDVFRGKAEAITWVNGLPPHDLTIATLNTKHFAPLPGLRVERPY